jgi:Ni,Fe-hydrogenase III component G
MQITEQIKEKLAGKIIDWHQPLPRRVYFSIKPEMLKEVAGFLFRELGLRFSIATGTDTPEGIEILYHFSFDKTGQFFSVRVLIKDRIKPEIDSISNLFPAAEWIEREMWELLGINFIGHPNLKHLLLSDEWPQGKYPLRKENVA